MQSIAALDRIVIWRVRSTVSDVRYQWTRLWRYFMDRSSPNFEHSFYVWCTKILRFLRPTLADMVTKNFGILTQNWL